MRAWIDELDDDHDVYVHSAQKSDLEDLAKWCAEARDAGMGNRQDEKFAMSCDGFTIMEWCNRNGIEWGHFWRDLDIQTRFVDDPANAAFRIWLGKL